MDKKFKIGDLVEINKGVPAWKHLNEKSDAHPLKNQGIIIEITDINYVIRFGNFTAFLKEKDLIKLSGEG